MHRSVSSYESNDVLGFLRDRNVAHYNCNKVGHKNHECKRKSFQSYGNPYTSSFNKNVRHNNHSQLERVDRTYVIQRLTWNKNKSIHVWSRNSFDPPTGHIGMDWKRRTSQFNRNLSTPQFGMNMVCYTCNYFGHIARYCRKKTVKPKKMIDVAMKKRKEMKKVLRMKQNTNNEKTKMNDSVTQHDTFHAHMTSPKP